MAKNSKKTAKHSAKQKAKTKGTARTARQLGRKSVQRKKSTPKKTAKKKVAKKAAPKKSTLKKSAAPKKAAQKNVVSKNVTPKKNIALPAKVEKKGIITQQKERKNTSIQSPLVPKPTPQKTTAPTQKDHLVKTKVKSKVPTT